MGLVLLGSAYTLGTKRGCGGDWVPLSSDYRLGTELGCVPLGDEEDDERRVQAQQPRVDVPPPRNHMQETAFLVQIILKLRFLVLDSGCILLRAAYAMSGTDVGERNRVCCAMYGTGVGSRGAIMRCVVLRSGMLLPLCDVRINDGTDLPPRVSAHALQKLLKLSVLSHTEPPRSS
eukprot:2096295-Rhodomonas_salina.7